MKAGYTRVGPGLPPVHGERAGGADPGQLPEPQKPGAGVLLRPPPEPVLADARRNQRCAGPKVG